MLSNVGIARMVLLGGLQGSNAACGLANKAGRLEHKRENTEMPLLGRGDTIALAERLLLGKQSREGRCGGHPRRGREYLDSLLDGSI